MHTCHYCKIFKEIESKLRRVEGRNGKKYYYRYCGEIGSEVQADSEPCEFFHPAEYFWCETDHNWMHVVACLNRNNISCPQRKDVLAAIRGFDIGKEFDMKPVLVQRIKEKKKLKLKLRKKKPKLIRRVK